MVRPPDSALSSKFLFIRSVKSASVVSDYSPTDLIERTQSSILTSFHESAGRIRVYSSNTSPVA